MSESDLTSEPENSGPLPTPATTGWAFRVSRLAAIMRASSGQRAVATWWTALRMVLVWPASRWKASRTLWKSREYRDHSPHASRTFKQMRAKGLAARRNLTDGDGAARAITLTDAGQTWLAPGARCLRRRGIRHGFWAKLDRQAAAHFSIVAGYAARRAFTTGSTNV